MRQLAWLNATPKPPARSRWSGKDEGEEPPPLLSRAEQMKKAGMSPPMPPDPMPHLTGWLVEIGLTEAAGMGAGPLTWASIRAWADLTAIALTPWEARILRGLSIAYLAEGRLAESESCPAPWRANLARWEREVEQSRLEAFFDEP